MFNILKQGIMKRELNFRIIFVVAALFATAGLFAQIPGYTDGAGTGTNYVSTATQATTDVTVGKTIPLFATPDSYYHPSYDPEDGSGLTAGFTWTWSTTAGTGSVTLGSAAANYVEVTGATVGAATVEVYESGALCADATPESIAINIMATPSVSITAPATDIEECEGDPSLDLGTTSVVATIANNGASNYRLVWSLEIYTENSSATPDEWFDTDLSTSLGAVQAFAEEYTQALPQAVAASGAVDITSVGAPNTDFITINNKTTVYTYTLTAINDLVSRRSDFLTIDDAVQGAGNAVNSATAGDFMYYDINGVNPLANTDVITITVHPVPSTGPIFHIDNDWAL